MLSDKIDITIILHCAHHIVTNFHYVSLATQA